MKTETAIEASKKYRKLAKGESPQAGDEYFDAKRPGWKPYCMGRFIGRAYAPFKFRRPITDHEN